MDDISPFLGLEFTASECTGGREKYLFSKTQESSRGDLEKVSN